MRFTPVRFVMRSCRLFVGKLLGVLAFSCAMSGGAAAVNVNVGDLVNASYVNAFSFAHNATIQDVFHFDLTAGSDFNAIASEVVVPTYFNISNFSVRLDPPVGPSLFFGPSAPTVGTGVLSLAPGNNYTLTVSGLADGLFGGSYSILLAAAATAPIITTSPIPEPGQWLLLLVGLLLLGRNFAFLRRSGRAVI